jgi:hypothetical protein
MSPRYKNIPCYQPIAGTGLRQRALLALPDRGKKTVGLVLVRPQAQKALTIVTPTA